MFARNFVLLSTVFVLGACTGSADKGNVDTGMMDDAVIVQPDDYDAGPAPGTQADLVVNVGDRVFFETDSSDLTASARVTLENQATWLRQYPSLGVTIEGHADERGTREYNLALGERRASAARNYLIALGVAPSRINTISYGKERPAVPGSNDASWSQNRRGVTKVQ